jgi:hypothetical protein
MTKNLSYPPINHGFLINEDNFFSRRNVQDANRLTKLKEGKRSFLPYHYVDNLKNLRFFCQ